MGSNFKFTSKQTEIECSALPLTKDLCDENLLVCGRVFAAGGELDGTDGHNLGARRRARQIRGRRFRSQSVQAEKAAITRWSNPLGVGRNVNRFGSPACSAGRVVFRLRWITVSVISRQTSKWKAMPT